MSLYSIRVFCGDFNLFSGTHEGLNAFDAVERAVSNGFLHLNYGTNATVFVKGQAGIAFKFEIANVGF